MKHTYIKSAYFLTNRPEIGCPFVFESTNSQSADEELGFIFTNINSGFPDGYIPWRKLIYNLSDYIGKTITIEGIAACCSNVKCKSTLFFAFENFGPQELCANCGVTKLTMPEGFSTYLWHKGSPNGSVISRD